MIGAKFGKLTCAERVGVRQFTSGRATYYRFSCDCGGEIVAQKANAASKKDCGCSRAAKKTAPPGASSRPLFKVWSAMIDRCENAANRSFKDYGARGIKVCRRWKTGDGIKTGFECFLADMGPRPEGMTIERVDRTGNYEPGNCVWLPKPDQSRNRRGVKLVRIDGEVLTIPQWCERTGVGYWTAIRRVSRGWPPDRAVTTPTKEAASAAFFVARQEAVHHG